MQIDQIPELSLGKPDEDAIARLLALAFDTDFGGRTYFHQRHHLRVVARDPGIVGHIALTFRSVALAGHLIPVLGLAEVATDPARRGEGIAQRLLQQTVTLAKSMPADFALLFGEAGLYQGAGFRTVKNQMRFVEIQEARTRRVRDAVPTNLMVLPLRPDAVWDDTAPLDLMGHLF